MEHIQAQILMAVAACLCMALLLSLMRPKRGTHNTVSVAVDCNVDEAREGIRQLTADVERLHAEVRASRRSLSELKVDRSIIGLPIYKVTNTTTKPAGQVPTRRSRLEPVPAAKKKAPAKR